MSSFDGVSWAKDLKHKAMIQATIDVSEQVSREYSLWFDPRDMLQDIVEAYCINKRGELDFSSYTRAILDHLFVALREHEKEDTIIEFKVSAHAPVILVQVTHFGDLSGFNDVDADRVFSIPVREGGGSLEEIAPGWPIALWDLGEALIKIVVDEKILWPLFRAGFERVEELSAYSRFF